MRWYYRAIRRTIEEDYKKVSSFQVILTICSTVGIVVIGTCSCLRAWIDVTQDRDRGQALVNVVINLRVP
jgi:hypothetical protein